MKTRKNNKSVIKNTLIAFLFTGLIFTGSAAYYQFTKNKKIQHQIDLEKINSKEGIIDLYSKIEKNLVEINAFEDDLKSSINNQTYKQSNTSEESITRKIGTIESLIEKNKQLVIILKSKVDEKDEQLIKYNNLINNLNKRVDQYKIKIKEMTLPKDSITSELTELLNNNIAFNGNVESKTEENNGNS